MYSAGSLRMVAVVVTAYERSVPLRKDACRDIHASFRGQTEIWYMYYACEVLVA